MHSSTFSHLVNVNLIEYRSVVGQDKVFELAYIVICLKRKHRQRFLDLFGMSSQFVNAIC